MLSAQSFTLNRHVAAAVTIKNVLQPVLAGLFAGLLLDAEHARVAVILAAVPSGAFGVLFAVGYRLPSAEVGTTLIISMVMSAMTLATTIALSALVFSG